MAPDGGAGINPFRLRVNWLPSSLHRSVRTARFLEGAGFDGLGVCDSPNYLECYTVIQACLEATSRLAVGPSVTNPVTRSAVVHGSAARALLEHGTDRFWFGVGTGDSAVRTHGGRQARLSQVEECIHTVREMAGCDIEVLFATGGPRGAELAGRAADGLIAGVGRSREALEILCRRASQQEADHPRQSLQLWASLRIAVATGDPDRAQLRRRLLPRAISAARFNFGGDFADKAVPAEYAGPLAEAFLRYDFNWHGRSGENPNASLLADRPDIGDYLLDRFAIIGTLAECRSAIEDLAELGFHGAFLSILFEEAEDQLELLSELPTPLATRRA